MLIQRLFVGKLEIRIVGSLKVTDCRFVPPNERLFSI